MEIKRIVVLLLIFIPLCSPAQEFKKHILFLASESMHGRVPGTEDETKAAEYIKNQLVLAKCNSVSFQSFPFKGKIAMNVIGMLDLKKDSTIIISAHYDHLDVDDEKSLEIARKGIHPGADDNASGVAMMLELAKSLVENKSLKYNFLFTGFSAHEAGLFGSDFFCNSSVCASLKIRAVINLDMVGRLDVDYPVVRINTSESDKYFHGYFNKFGSSSLHLQVENSHIDETDLKSFDVMKIPVVNISTGINLDYHRMSDTEDKINYEGMKVVYDLVQNLIRFLNT